MKLLLYAFVLMFYIFTFLCNIIYTLTLIVTGALVIGLFNYIGLVGSSIIFLSILLFCYIISAIFRNKFDEEYNKFMDTPRVKI